MPDRLRPSHRGRLRPVAVLGFLCTTLALAACDTDAVTIAGSAVVGDVQRYEVSVDHEVRRRLEPGAIASFPDAERTTAVLEVTASVVEDPDGTVATDVEVRRNQEVARRFRVAAGDGDGAAVAGAVVVGSAGTLFDSVALGSPAVPDSPAAPDSPAGPGLTGFGGTTLPGRLAAPPATPLRPGDRWQIDTVVAGPDGEDRRITGDGRLDRLDRRDGFDVAVVVVDIDVPVRAVSEGAEGRISLSGTQRTTTTTAYRIDDGSVHDAETTVAATLDLAIEPPESIAAPPVRGTLDYTLRTVTRRR